MWNSWKFILKFCEKWKSNNNCKKNSRWINILRWFWTNTIEDDDKFIPNQKFDSIEILVLFYI